MSDILLIHPDYPWPLKYPPVGLAYLAAYLEKEGGYTVRIIDLAVEKMTPEQLLFTIRKARSPLLGISFMTCQAIQAYALSDRIRAEIPGVLTVGGGPHASSLPHEAVEHFDFIVVGEGEKVLCQLADHVIKGERWVDPIQGLMRRRDQIRNVQRALPIDDLDSLPFPAWHLLQIDKYRGLGMGLDSNQPFLVIISSRGCPNHCIFCASHIVHGRKFRFRSPTGIAEEIAFTMAAFGVRQFDFADDTMTVSEDRILDLSDIIMEKQLDIRWDCNARVNTVSLRMLEAMKSAGCVRVNFGVESGDSVLLKRSKKGITLTQIREAHCIAKQVGLRTLSFFMIGLPGETKRTIRRTFDFSEELHTDHRGLTFATPYPGTQLYETATQRGWLDSRPWDFYTTTVSGDSFTPVMRNDDLTRQQLLQSYHEMIECFQKADRVDHDSPFRTRESGK